MHLGLTFTSLSEGGLSTDLSCSASSSCLPPNVEASPCSRAFSCASVLEAISLANADDISSEDSPGLLLACAEVAWRQRVWTALLDLRNDLIPARKQARGLCGHVTQCCKVAWHAGTMPPMYDAPEMALQSRCYTVYTICVLRCWGMYIKSSVCAHSASLVTALTTKYNGDACLLVFALHPQAVNQVNHTLAQKATAGTVSNCSCTSRCSPR